MFEEGTEESGFKASWVMIQPSVQRNSLIISSETPDPEKSEILIQKIEDILKPKKKTSPRKKPKK